MTDDKQLDAWLWKEAQKAGVGEVFGPEYTRAVAREYHRLIATDARPVEDEARALWLALTDKSMRVWQNDEPIIRAALDKARSEATACMNQEGEEAHKIGVSEGFDMAVAELDQRTGGDGEYYASTIPGRGCPDARTMMQGIVDRFNEATARAENAERERDEANAVIAQIEKLPSVKMAAAIQMIIAQRTAPEKGE